MVKGQRKKIKDVLKFRQKGMDRRKKESDIRNKRVYDNIYKKRI